MAIKAPYIGKSGSHDLDEAVFGEEFHMALVHECAKAELNAKRQGTQSAKTRGEVAMTGAKAFRQKGTGRARAGALSTPQRYGGGVAFAPKPRHYVVKVNRKARRRALRAALSVHADRVPNRAIIMAVEDNLVKGASGQAVQNMNVMAGFPEETALEQLPLFP